MTDEPSGPDDVSDRPSDGDPARPGQSTTRVQMPLLTLITHQALEEDYLQSAERRAAAGAHGPRRRSRRTATVVVAVFGILLSTAAVQHSRNADVDDASRTTLIEKVDGQRERVAAQQERTADLQDRNAALSRSLTRLTDSASSAEASNRRLRVRTGFLAVRGEGVRITITEREGADDNQSVHGSDLVMLTNGLWQVGAEAVAVNGQRLSAASAISASGLAITVNDVGVSAPYEVEAIGDNRTLASELFNTDSGLIFDDLSRRFDFDYEVDTVDQLELPSAPSSKLRLRSVQAIPGASRDPASTQQDKNQTSKGGDGP